MIGNRKAQMSNALSFPTSHYLLKSVGDKVVKSCLKNWRPYKNFCALTS